MSDSLKPLEVKTINIASKAVSNDKIADKAVDNRTIKEGSVTPDKLTITPVSRPISPPVESNEIKNGAVTPDKLSFQIVTRPLNPQISTAEIRDGAITKEKMADGTIGTAELIDGSVTSAKLAASSVTSAKIAAGAVKGSEIYNGSVSTEKLSSNAVTTEKIQNGAVTPEKLSFTPPSITRPITPPLESIEIGSNVVTSDKIQDGAVTQEKLAPTVQLGDRFVYLTPATVVLYLTSQTVSIPETEIDLSAVIPVGTKAVIARAQIYTESATPGNTQFIMHLRKPGIGGEPSVRVGQNPGTGREAENDGLCPVDANRKITYQVETGPGTGNTTATFIVVITAYIM